MELLLDIVLAMLFGFGLCLALYHWLRFVVVGIGRWLKGETNAPPDRRRLS